MTTQGRIPLRLALIITELEVGGAERCLVRLACSLPRERYEPEVYSLSAAPHNTQLIEQLESHGVVVHFLNSRRPWSFVPLIRRLKKHIQRQQPHVVQSFLFHANIAASFLASRDRHVVFGARVADPRPWRNWLERQRSRKADSVVCVSQMVADHLQRHRFNSNQLLVIPKGVDADRFASAPRMSLKHVGIADEQEVILFLGRLDEQKGLDWLLEAIHPVLRSRPNSFLVLAGKGDWFRFRRGAAEHSSRILCLGWQSDVAGLLKRSSLLVLPSRWEGMPNVLLEAMAAGVPVLSTDVEGVREVLGARADPQTVRFGNTEDFAHKALQLLEDERLRSDLIAANHARVRSEFSIERMMSAYDRLYCELCVGSAVC